jgi:aminoglycoside phosphotransferase (APT) family kinase protein
MSVTKMHVDEVETDAGLVRRLLAEQFPHWGRLPIEPVLSSGTDNALYRLGDEMVVRLSRRERDSGSLERERLWLPRLAPLLPLPIPAPLADGRPAEGYPFEWSVYRWLPGEDATTAAADDETQLAIDLAHFLGALQRIDPEGGPPPGDHNVFRGEPLRRRDAGTRASIAALHVSIDVRAVTAAWDSALSAPDWEQSPVWIHGDLDARNLLTQDGRLSGVID